MEPGGVAAVKSLEELMQRYCEGDAAAFDELYTRVAPKLLAYLRYLLADRSSAEDILQQAFMKLHGSRGSYIQGADPVPWLYAIAHRTCLDELRRRKRSRVRLDREGDGAPEVRAAITGGALDAESGPPYAEETVKRAMAALETLPEEQRTAVVLTKLHGLSSASAAAVLGISSSAVKQRVHRAYLALRPVLAAQREADDESVLGVLI